MSVSDRDRKILIILVPLLVVAGYWFLLLAPKRDEVAKLDEELIQVQIDRDDAVAQADLVASSKHDFAADFAEVLRVGKAIPSTVDMPSLIVQLDRAADGTGIGFHSIKAGARIVAVPTAPAPADGSAPPVAAGGEQAASAPGGAAEKANDGAATSEARSAESGSTGTDAATGAPATTADAAPGLDSIPLDFTFTGDFFELADFLHRLKRFVHVNDKRIVVDGRLMIVESFALKMKNFPTLEATMTAKVYLSPEAEGADAGATPAGPATTTPAGGSAPAPTPAPAPTSAPASP